RGDRRSDLAAHRLDVVGTRDDLRARQRPRLAAAREIRGAAELPANAAAGGDDSATLGGDGAADDDAAGVPLRIADDGDHAVDMAGSRDDRRDDAAAALRGAVGDRGNVLDIG